MTCKSGAGVHFLSLLSTAMQKAILFAAAFIALANVFAAPVDGVVKNTHGINGMSRQEIQMRLERIQRREIARSKTPDAEITPEQQKYIDDLVSEMCGDPAVAESDCIVKQPCALPLRGRPDSRCARSSQPVSIEEFAEAGKTGDFELFERLFRVIDREGREERRKAALLEACKHGQTDFVRRLNEKFDKDFGESIFESFYYGVEAASTRGHWDIVDYLMAVKTRTQWRPFLGEHAIVEAAKIGDVDRVVKYIAAARPWPQTITAATREALVNGHTDVWRAMFPALKDDATNMLYSIVDAVEHDRRDAFDFMIEQRPHRLAYIHGAQEMAARLRRPYYIQRLKEYVDRIDEEQEGARAEFLLKNRKSIREYRAQQAHVIPRVVPSVHGPEYDRFHDWIKSLDDEKDLKSPTAANGGHNNNDDDDVGEWTF